MSKRGKCEVVGYSERGMVNELVYFIRTSPHQLDAIRSLMNGCVEYIGDQEADEAKPPIQSEVEQLLGKMDNFTLIVESSFAQFGDPDLVIIPKAGEQNLALFFIEAKVGDYKHSADLCRSSLDMRQKGFNSTIIGQLSLRYRLSKALAHRSETEWKGPRPLIETEGMAVAYQHMEGGPRRRSLSKAANLKHLLPEFRLDCEEPAEWEGRCYFIALTSDEKMPFENNFALQRGGVPIGYSSAEIEQQVPHYYSESGAEGTPCGAAIQRTGWMGWCKIEQCFREALLQQTSYQKTSQLAFTASGNRGAASSCCGEQHRSVSTVKWNADDVAAEKLRERWRQSFLSLRQDSSDTMFSYMRFKTSDSGIYGPQTVFKLLNLSEGNAITLREDVGVTIDPMLGEPVCIQRKPFRMFRFTPGEDESDLLAMVSGFMQERQEKS